jgi:heme oxygenase-like protein
MNVLPSHRGEISEFLLAALRRTPHSLARLALPGIDDPLGDHDLQLALYLCYELHYRGLPDVDERWEWEPSLLALRAQLEEIFEDALRQAVPLHDESPRGEPVDVALRAIAAREGVALSPYIQRQASVQQVREFLVHRSAYQLKEADPHSWAIPRLDGPPKAALIEIQADEYGGGRPEWIHAELFARSMRSLGLDPTYGAYLDLIPGITLATVNQMSLFGLHRRLRGAIVGHLALFEMTSSIPNRRYGDGLRRLGWNGDATLFFDEHVEADAVHENVATVDLAGGLVRQDPSMQSSIIWGALTLAHLGERWAAHVLGCWEDGRCSLLGELEDHPSINGGAASPVPAARNPTSL